MTEIRESPSGPLVSVGGGPDITILGRINIPAGTNIVAGTVLERTISLGAIVDNETTRKWRVTANLIPSADGITNEIPSPFSWEPPGVQLGSDEVEARIGIANYTESDADTGANDLDFGIAAYFFADG